MGRLNFDQLRDFFGTFRLGDWTARGETAAGREIADARAEAEHVGLELREAAEAGAAAKARAAGAGADVAGLRERLREAAQGHASVAARQPDCPAMPIRRRWPRLRRRIAR